MMTNSSVGASSGSVTLQNRRMPPAPSTTAASWRSRGMPCRPAVMRMNVKPRLAQTLESGDRHQGRVGVAQQPRRLDDGEQVADPGDIGQHPDSGSRRNSHIRLATATVVAIVDEKMVGRSPTPRQVLVGQHGKADAEGEAERDGDQRELDRDPERRPGTRAPGYVDVLVPPVGLAVVALARRSASGRARRPARAGTARTRSGSRATARASRRPSARRASERRSTAGGARPQCRTSAVG